MTPLDNDTGHNPATDAPTERERFEAERRDRQIEQIQKDRDTEAN